MGGFDGIRWVGWVWGGFVGRHLCQERQFLGMKDFFLGFASGTFALDLPVQESQSIAEVASRVPACKLSWWVDYGSRFKKHVHCPLRTDEEHAWIYLSVLSPYLLIYLYHIIYTLYT